MLAKMPHKTHNTENHETSAVNSKLLGLNILLIAMLGVTGAYIILPFFEAPQTTSQVIDISNNSTSDTPSTTNTKQHIDTTIQNNKKNATATNSVTSNRNINGSSTLKSSSTSKRSYQKNTS